nr:hypothetical protein [Tessaracoccus massiliensis]
MLRGPFVAARGATLRDQVGAEVGAELVDVLVDLALGQRGRRARVDVVQDDAVVERGGLRLRGGGAAREELHLHPCRLLQ